MQWRSFFYLVLCVHFIKHLSIRWWELSRYIMSEGRRCSLFKIVIKRFWNYHRFTVNLVSHRFFNFWIILSEILIWFHKVQSIQCTLRYVLSCIVSWILDSYPSQSQYMNQSKFWTDTFHEWEQSRNNLQLSGKEIWIVSQIDSSEEILLQ